MAALASLSELEAYLGRSVDTEAGELLLDIGSSVVRTYTGQVLEQVSETVVLRGTGHGGLLLPQFPVSAVTSVTVDAVLADALTYRWERNGRLWLADGNWASGYWNTTWAYDALISVVYTHGYAVIPGDIKAVVLGLASRVVQNPGGYDRESIGSYSYSTGGNPGASWSLTDADMAALAPYCHLVAA